MTEVVFQQGFLNNERVKYLRRKDIAAVTIAGGGAMGTPGEVVIYYVDDGYIIEAKGNYVYGNLDLDKLCKCLHLEARGPKAWTEYDLGMGNTLFVNARDYESFDFNLSQCPEMVGEVYRREAWIVLSAMHRIMDELREKIYAELYGPQIHDEPGPADDEELLDMGMPVTVCIAMSEEQAQRENCTQCFSDFPDASRIYLEMDAVPADLCLERETGWEKKLCLKKVDFTRLISLWYPDGVDWDWKQALDRIDGDTVWIIAFGD